MVQPHGKPAANRSEEAEACAVGFDKYRFDIKIELLRVVLLLHEQKPVRDFTAPVFRKEG